MALDGTLNTKIRKLNGMHKNEADADKALAKIVAAIEKAGFEPCTSDGKRHFRRGKKGTAEFAHAYVVTRHQRKDSKDGKYKRGVYFSVESWVTMSEGANKDYELAYPVKS